MAAALFEHGAPPWVWFGFFFGALVWPHVAYQLTTRSRDPDRAETYVLLVDAALAGFGVYAVGANTVPSMVAVTIIAMNNMAVAGWKQWLKGFAAMGLGALTTAVALPWREAPMSSNFVQLATLPVVLIYFSAFGWAMLNMARRLQRSREELRKLSELDALAGVCNRRAFEDRAAVKMERLRRKSDETGAVLLLLDVDHFKHINDTWGHRAGDEVIEAIGNALRESLRTNDLAGRYGGDEFAVLLSEGGVPGARAFASRLRSRLAEAIRPGDGLPPVTLSMGGAAHGIYATSVRNWLARADSALYQVKRTARGALLVLSDAEPELWPDSRTPK